MKADVAGSLMTVLSPFSLIDCQSCHVDFLLTALAVICHEDWWDSSDEAGAKTRPQAPCPLTMPTLSVLAVEGGKVVFLGAYICKYCGQNTAKINTDADTCWYLLFCQSSCVKVANSSCGCLPAIHCSHQGENRQVQRCF